MGHDSFSHAERPVLPTSPPILRARAFATAAAMSEVKHHVAILPSAGMGHLVVSVRLAVALASHGCLVSLITPRPVVSDAESHLISDLHSSFPHIRPLDLDLLSSDAFTADATDNFLLQLESIRRSSRLLRPLLASVTPPLCALVTDVMLLSAVIPVTAGLHLQNYVAFTSSSMILALLCVFPEVRKAGGGGPIAAVEIPGVGTLPGSWIPPPLHDPGHLFTTQFVENGQALLQADGILINTFEALEGETLAALNAGEVVPGLPPVIPIGPQQPVPFGRGNRGVGWYWAAWLDAQPPRSVVYVAFGNRTALSKDQIRELGVGLERSGCRFLWVVKSKVVDREEEGEVGLEELLGQGYLERVGERGMVVKRGVEQDVVLAHGSVGGFLSHCGWNSVVEAAMHGVRVLAWPPGGDQGVNAAVAEEGGLGVWVKGWGWAGRGEEAAPAVSGEEIGERVKELMGDAGLGESVARVHEEAAKAVGVGGSSYEALRGFVAKLRSP